MVEPHLGSLPISIRGERIKSPRRRRPAPDPQPPMYPRELVQSLADLLPLSDSAACAGADQDLFFPERGKSTREAKAICRGCDVREGCLEWAMAHNEKFGIWGGMSEKERRALRRRRLGAVAQNGKAAEGVANE